MRGLAVWAGVVFCCFLIVPVAADTLFNYDGFYSRLKKSEKVEYSDITLAFMLQQQATSLPCDVASARITTDISDEPLTIANNGELILPYSELLNSRKALIQLQQPPAAKACDLNFRLRSKLPLDAGIKWQQLVKMHQQFDGLLKDLAGLGKYFLPEMTGVTLQFEREVVLEAAPAELAGRIHCELLQCQVLLADATELQGEIRFNQAPHTVLPLLPR
ncbi:hypothetical protein A5320_10830 [Rheinheimera sp. SA_1]|uniref:DUF2987 domain-containing protein n=1 Tax=Rheinheimera sp. SA_1 TaxID=1827365 RepID=UPI0008023F50|nr:DUF2987 domain-containing protein [Rheinheimera sp. SA_1]OBP14284.1 hypothetical protein A5320_10830 [Rheinheimera sp. SA_1]